MSLTVFYGAQIYDAYSTWNNLWYYIRPAYTSEIYNGAYVYDAILHSWYRCDGTPCLIEDVPKVLQMLQLVLKL